MIMLLREPISYLRSLFYSVNEEAIFLLGNEKSGTTAIAALLSMASGSSVQLDIPEVWDPMQTKLHGRCKKLSEFIAGHSFRFSKDIIKEPVLTFEIECLRTIFPNARFNLIIRDPRNNIRSILNRLAIDAKANDINSIETKENAQTWTSWLTVLDNEWLLPREDHTSFIKSMSLRWNYIYELSLRHQEYLNVVKYEDFLENKVEFIEKLCASNKLSSGSTFHDQVDHQYQSKGDNSLSWEAYFGEENLSVINSICEEGIKYFGYEY